jgi:hypothetical protein
MENPRQVHERGAPIVSRESRFHPLHFHSAEGAFRAMPLSICYGFCVGFGDRSLLGRLPGPLRLPPLPEHADQPECGDEYDRSHQASNGGLAPGPLNHTLSRAARPRENWFMP